MPFRLFVLTVSAIVVLAAGSTLGILTVSAAQDGLAQNRVAPNRAPQDRAILKSTAPASARIEVVDNLAFHGRKFRGERYDVVGKYRNVGDAPLEISRISPKCPCTKIGEYTKVVAPGEVGEVSFAVDTNKIDFGNWIKDVFIASNDPKQNQVTLSYKVSVLKTLAFEPKDLTVRGLANAEKSQEFIVGPNAQFPLEIEKVESLTEGVTAMVEPAGGGRTRLTVTANATSVVGTRRAEIELIGKANNQVIGRVIGLRVVDNPVVSCVPVDGIVFLSADTDPLLEEGGKKPVKVFEVRSFDESINFEITGVRFERVPEGLFEAEVVTVEEGRRYSVQIRCLEYSKRTLVRGKAFIETNLENVIVEAKVQARFGKRR